VKKSSKGIDLAIVDVIKEKMAKGASISEITHGRPTGGGK
jgi:hypothetical protein